MPPDISTEISQMHAEIKQIYNKSKNKFGMILTAIGLSLITIAFIIIGAVGYNRYEKAIEMNKKLMLLSKDNVLKIIIEKDFRKFLNGMKTVRKIENLPWIDYTDNEINLAVIELYYGEVNYGIGYKEIFAYIAAESGGYKNAESSREAMGIMQLMPDTRQDLLNEFDEENLGNFNVPQNLKLSIKYIMRCRYKIEHGYGILAGTGKATTKEQELWAYNAGFGNVIRNRWWDYQNDIYLETKDFVKKWAFYYKNFTEDIYNVYYERPDKKYENQPITANIIKDIVNKAFTKK